MEKDSTRSFFDSDFMTEIIRIMTEGKYSEKSLKDIRPHERDLGEAPRFAKAIYILTEILKDSFISKEKTFNEKVIDLKDCKDITTLMELAEEKQKLDGEVERLIYKVESLKQFMFLVIEEHLEKHGIEFDRLGLRKNFRIISFRNPPMPAIEELAKMFGQGISIRVQGPSEWNKTAQKHPVCLGCGECEGSRTSNPNKNKKEYVN